MNISELDNVLFFDFDFEDEYGEHVTSWGSIDPGPLEVAIESIKRNRSLEDLNEAWAGGTRNIMKRVGVKKPMDVVPHLQKYLAYKKLVS